MVVSFVEYLIPLPGRFPFHSRGITSARDFCYHMPARGSFAVCLWDVSVAALWV